MIQRPLSEGPRKISKTEIVGRVVTGIGVTALVGVVGNLTWEGMGGQHVPTSTYVRDLWIIGGGLTAVGAGFTIEGVGNHRRTGN